MVTEASPPDAPRRAINDSFDWLVLDEGHSLKNLKSQRATRLRALRAAHRLILSGTPIQAGLSRTTT